MRKILFALGILAILNVPSYAQFGGGAFGEQVTNPLKKDLEVGTKSIDGDSTNGLAFDPDNDGTNEVTMPAAGGINVGGTNERITGTTNGEYIDFGTDDEILFQGVNGSDNTDIRMDLDGTHPVLYSSTDGKIEVNESMLISSGATSIVSFESTGITAFVDIITGGAKILDSDGTLIIGGTGGNNNEDLNIDFETTSNRVKFSSTTSANLETNQNLYFSDDRGVFFGGSADSRIMWNTTGNDNLSITTKVGSSTESGYIAIYEEADLNSVNRAPSGTSADPVLRIYSSNATGTEAANQKIDFYHNQADSVIDSGFGDLRLQADVVATGLIVAVGKTADPCTAKRAGAIFYNSTANELCFCNGTNDLRVKDATTACF